MNPTGTLLGYEVARQLRVHVLVAVQTGSSARLLKGQTIAKHQRLLVVDDVSTTGSSLSALRDVARSNLGRVAGAAVVANTADFKIEQHVTAISLLRLSSAFASWPEGECPLCEGEGPLEEPR